jgi:hypothetical protein
MLSDPTAMVDLDLPPPCLFVKTSAVQGQTRPIVLRPVSDSGQNMLWSFKG